MAPHDLLKLKLRTGHFARVLRVMHPLDAQWASFVGNWFTTLVRLFRWHTWPVVLARINAVEPIVAAPRRPPCLSLTGERVRKWAQPLRQVNLSFMPSSWESKYQLGGGGAGSRILSGTRSCVAMPCAILFDGIVNSLDSEVMYYLSANKFVRYYLQTGSGSASWGKYSSCRFQHLKSLHSSCAFGCTLWGPDGKRKRVRRQR